MNFRVLINLKFKNKYICLLNLFFLIIYYLVILYFSYKFTNFILDSF